jgi:hypothetical protein
MRGEERELKEIVGVLQLRDGSNSRTPSHHLQQARVMVDSHLSNFLDARSRRHRVGPGRVG